MESEYAPSSSPGAHDDGAQIARRNEVRFQEHCGCITMNTRDRKGQELKRCLPPGGARVDSRSNDEDGGMICAPSSSLHLDGSGTADGLDESMSVDELYECAELETEMLLRPETRSLSHEQLVDEVNGIYAGLVMGESKCFDIDERQSLPHKESDSPRSCGLDDDKWQSLVDLHKLLLSKDRNFFLESQSSFANPIPERLGSNDPMPARVWRDGGQGSSRMFCPGNGQSTRAAPCKRIPSFEGTWTESLDNLGRDRMAIEDSELQDRDVWRSRWRSGIARFLYDNAANQAPNVGRLCRKRAILARPYASAQPISYAQTSSDLNPYQRLRRSRGFAKDSGDRWPTLESLYERFNPEENARDPVYQQASMPASSSKIPSKVKSTKDFSLLELVLGLSIVQAIEDAWNASWPKLLKDLVQQRISIEDQVYHEREIWTTDENLGGGEIPSDAAKDDSTTAQHPSQILERLPYDPVNPHVRAIETVTDSSTNAASPLRSLPKPQSHGSLFEDGSGQITRQKPVHLARQRVFRPYTANIQSLSSHVPSPVQRYQPLLPGPFISSRTRSPSFLQILRQSRVALPPCYTLIAFGVLAIIGSLAPALWISIYCNDVSSGFALAQYILGVGVLVIGSPLVIHSQSCKCWE